MSRTMRGLAQAVYNLLLPVFCLLAAPAWLMRMARRGGLSGRLWERLGIYDRASAAEARGSVYVHAVSVGEVLMALKLIARWKELAAGERFTLAATTSTGFDLARERALAGVRVIYSPVDLPFLVAGLYRRFAPRVLVLIDSELWPNLLRGAGKRGVPVVLVNARVSERSARRYERLAPLVRPMLASLRLVCVQAREHVALWRRLGVRSERLAVTGSVKFDPEGTAAPVRRDDIRAMLEAFGEGRAVVLGASTHPGEEVLVARAAASVPGVLPVLVPRHAERRHEVAESLRRGGFEVVLRSAFNAPRDADRAVLVVDSTGELRDWTAHAALVVIGKSFEGRGGQNPSEAIMAGAPVVTGPHMENFEPLIGQLRSAGAVRTAARGEELTGAIADLLKSAGTREDMAGAARRILDGHRGATTRCVERIMALDGPATSTDKRRRGAS